MGIIGTAFAFLPALAVTSVLNGVNQLALGR